MIKKSKPFLALLPVVGFFLYICFYIIATLYYPGGSFIDKNSKGFRWDKNYWCELLAVHGKNGDLNNGRLFALIAMVSMVISLIVFWNLIPFLFSTRSKWKKLISITGIGSMLVIPLMLLGNHDTVINIAGSLGVTGILLTTYFLFRNNLPGPAWLGVFSLFLCILNTYSYYFNQWMQWLPYIQKFTFLVLITWFSWLSILVYRKLKSLSSGSGSNPTNVLPEGL